MSAARMALRGFPVLELQPGKKEPPRHSRWRYEAVTTDPADAFDIRGNYGVRCDRLIVIDVDGHKGGFESLPELGELPATFTVQTPRGGRHFYYFAPDNSALASRTEIVPGIDIKTGQAAYVVGPGSEIDGKRYDADNMAATVAPAPPWLIERLSTSKPRALDAGKIVGPVDTPEAVARATAYLTHAAPIAVEGQGGDPTTIKVANRVMDEGITPELAAELMAEHWNDRCEPPWEFPDLEYKVGSAFKSRQESIPSQRGAAAGFEALPQERFALSDMLEFSNEVSLAEIAAREANAIVKGHLRPGECGMIYGASGAGKSFLALDLAYHVALGNDWHGNRVKRPRAVLYVCLEGVAGFRKRMLASTAKHKDPGRYFARLKLPVSLVRGDAGAKGVSLIVEAFTALLKETGETDGLIFVDTLARAMAGDDENSTADMTHFVEHRQAAIAKATSAATIVVHHTGKSGTVRGNTSNFAAQDFVARVEREGDVRMVVVEKSKDGTEGPLFTFKLEVMNLGADEDGDVITSCTVAPTDAPSPRRHHTASQRALIAALNETRGELADPDTGELLSGASEDAVRKAMVGQVTNPGTRKSHWRRLYKEAGLPHGVLKRTIGGVPYFIDATNG